MTRAMCAGVAMGLVMMCAVPSGHADEVTDEIQAGLNAYQAKNYTTALSSLEYASQQIRQIKAGLMEQALPEALSGWEASASESSTAAAVFAGGGSQSSRTYRKGNAEVRIEIVSDSPMLGMMMGMMSNPLMMGASGAKVMKVNGYQSALQWDASGRSGELSVVAGSTLVKVSGSDCESADVEAYAKAVRYDRIQELTTN